MVWNDVPFFGTKEMSWDKESRMTASGDLGLPLSFPSPISTRREV